MATRLPLFPLGTVLVPGLVLPLHVFEPRYRALVRDLQELPAEAQVFGVIATRSAQVATDAGITDGGDAAGEPDVGEPDVGEPGQTGEAGPEGAAGQTGAAGQASEAGEAGQTGEAGTAGEARGAGGRRDRTASSAAPALYEVGCTAQIQEITPYDDGRADMITVGQERFRVLRLLLGAGTPYLTAEVELLGEPDGDDADLGYLAQLVGLRFAAYRERLLVEQSGVPTDPRVLSYLVSAAAVLELRERQALLEASSTADRLRAEVALLRRETGLLDAFAALPAVDLARQPVAPN